VGTTFVIDVGNGVGSGVGLSVGESVGVSVGLAPVGYIVGGGINGVGGGTYKVGYSVGFAPVGYGVGGIWGILNT
jgi:hypothetical protein